MNLSIFPYTLSCTLTEAQNDFLNKYCTENNVPKTVVIRRALQAYFNGRAGAELGRIPLWPDDEE